MTRLRTALSWAGRRAGIVVLVLAAAVLGYVLRGGCAPAQVEVLTAEPTPGAGAGTAEEAVTVWTCSMHPQIRQPGPGRCPICAMDLIPVTTGLPAEEGGLRRFETSEAGKKLMEIQTAPVERRFVTAEIRMVGKVAYDETRLGYITAWVPGRLDRLFVDYTGIEVKKGEHMVEIYSPELLATQEELLQAVQAARELEASDLAVMRETARATVDAAREKLRLWGLTTEQVAGIEARGEPADHITVYSPMGGVVIHRNAQEGMYVKTGARLYTIADLSQLWVKLDAYESDLQWLRYGQEVQISTEAHPGEVFAGWIAFIDPVVDEGTRTVKVRVDVPNPDRRLKPGMFVRAFARADVALGGRVMDPRLTGKWICPMHPGVVAEGPEACAVCGMDLVTVESLGYLAASHAEAAKPLVIPVSAALVTGTRAVAYVEVPGAERPTYEGREIVLGPRAGDYYLVRHGLEEGETVVTNGNFKIDSTVVTNGNFKIDSALQIQAKPSMMTPQGGAGGGVHHHGEEGPATAEQPQAVTEVPEAFRLGLHGILGGRDAVARAMDTNDLESIRSAFDRFGIALVSVDGEVLSGHARTLWQEVSMLLENDVAEGSEAATLEAAGSALASLTSNVERVRSEFGVHHVHELAGTAGLPAEHPGERHPEHPTEAAPELEPEPESESPPAEPGGAEDVPQEFQRQLGTVLASYFDIQAALAGDDRQAAGKRVGDALTALAAVDMKLVRGDAHLDWMAALGDLERAIGGAEEAKDMVSLRKAFARFSETMAEAVQRFGVHPADPVYRLHCPMAFQGLGADWLQRDTDTRNPYFGSSMLKCGRVVEIIGGGRAKGTEGLRHE
jgi:Cu(I)/Ag(I) efflux system membrane fusion protein